MNHRIELKFFNGGYSLGKAYEDDDCEIYIGSGNTPDAGYRRVASVTLRELGLHIVGGEELYNPIEEATRQVREARQACDDFKARDIIDSFPMIVLGFVATELAKDTQKFVAFIQGLARERYLKGYEDGQSDLKASFRELLGEASQVQ